MCVFWPFIVTVVVYGCVQDARMLAIKLDNQNDADDDTRDAASLQRRPRNIATLPAEGALTYVVTTLQHVVMTRRLDRLQARARGHKRAFDALTLRRSFVMLVDKVYIKRTHTHK